MKEADINQACLCLAVFVPGTDYYCKRAAERCCTLQLFAGDDLQSTPWVWHPATSDKPDNLLCISSLLRFCQKQCQQTKVQKVSKVLHQIICLALLDGNPTGSYERVLGQSHSSVVFSREITCSVLSERAKQTITTAPSTLMSYEK